MPDEFTDTDVVRRILVATRRGKVPWRRSAEYEFTAVLGETQMRFYTRDGDGVAPFVLELASESDITEITYKINREPRAEEHNSAMQSLWESAGSASITVAPVVRNLLAELDRVDPEPPF